MRDVAAGSVLTPSTAEEASQILRAAADAGVRTRFSTRTESYRNVLLVSSVKLNHIAEYEPADLVVSAEAGVTLDALAHATAHNNQFLALDPPDPSATLGKVVATGAAGPLRCAHGTPRDQVLGLSVVAGDGRMLGFGGKVVKNVAGYDVVRLMVGSRGTLGFITGVHIRLKPLPAVDRTLVVRADDPDELIALARAMNAAHLDPAALEIVSRPQWQLWIRLHGNNDAVVDLTQRVNELTGTEEQNADTWLALAREEAGSAVCIRMAGLPSLLPNTLREASALAQAVGISDRWFAIHANEGIVRLMGSSATSNSAALEAARAAMIEAGGSLIVERFPGENPGLNQAGRNAELMRQIRKVFDPAGILGG